MTTPRERQFQQQVARRLFVIGNHLLPEGQLAQQAEQPSVQTVETTRSPEDLYGTAKLPGKVKEQEAPFNPDGSKRTGDIVDKDGVKEAPIRLNAAYCDLDLDGGRFKPVSGVMYLWAIREDGHLVVGVVDPSRMRAAFQFDPAEVVKTIQAKKREQGGDVPSDGVLDGLGHPTIAIQFGPNGEALVGTARIGGELEAHGGAWKINDHSGRYSAGRTAVLPYLINAAKKFRGFGIDVQFIQSKIEFRDQIKSMDELTTGKD
jgi:hypothetical protein